MNLFNLKANPKLTIEIDNRSQKKHVTITNFTNKKTFKIPVFYKNDDISGIVKIDLGSLKHYSHRGIRINFYGIRKFKSQKENDSSFIFISKEILPMGILHTTPSFPFHFKNFDKPYESYYGQKL
jgi:vacuolar protein sorting-associated protein 26